jgi:multicomponent Na+:H+ antiporter subunit G
VSDALDVLAGALLVAGVGFLVVSALGLLRFPDFWTRSHAVAKAETLGLVLVFAGLVVANRAGPGSVQLVLIAAFSLLVNPTAIHALARSAVRRNDAPDIAGSSSPSAARLDDPDGGAR